MAGRRFTETEKQLIREEYQALGCLALSQKLGRTMRSVYLAARVVGAAVRRPSFGSDFDTCILERHAKGESDAEIGLAWGCDRHTVGQRREQLGLPVNTLSEHRRQRVRKKTLEQLNEAGLGSLAEVRAKAFRDRAKAAGWPEDLRPRAVRILNSLWDNGPQTRRELARSIGLPWRGSRKSLKSRDPEGSYLANLAARGLVVRIERAAKGKGKGRSCHVYSLPLWIQRGKVSSVKE